MRAWPGKESDDAAAERLLSALDELVAKVPDDRERSRLAKAREVLVDVSAKTLSELAAKAAGGAI